MTSSSLVAIGAFVVVFLAVCGVGFLASRPRSGTAPVGPAARRPPSARHVVFVVVAALTLAIVIPLALLRGAAAVLQSIPEWVVAPIAGPLIRVVLQPHGLGAIGAIVLVAGLPFASRFRRPRRFTGGVVLASVALLTFWPLQSLAARADVRFAEWNTLLHGAALVFSISLLGAGLDAIRRANNTPKDDAWEFWF